MFADTIGISQLAELINSYCGIDYKKDLPALQSKVSRRLKELGLSYWEYCGYLNMEPNEWDTLIELITVNETYFFREENFLEEFRKVILPQYVGRTSQNPLRIWSAACSTGEEPYTIGMLVEESGLFQPGEVQIIASDINKKVLEKAKSGVYKKKSFSFRRMPEGAYEKFFIELDDAYKVKDSIRNMVDFRYINLLDNDVADQIGKVDIIICKNVLIYFDNNTIKKVINTFYDILKMGGYLFLGHAETITGMNSGFEAIYTPSIFYYKKGGKNL
ncbi:MCP methyltransferase, CheR-type [Thermoanaerobacter ethanolicus JW 200]|uniref:CheR family methyltransferase n=1 Tax=Thermoanaerobacter ethanolicus TaxID=1757 RepID=UPI000202C1F0|nr:MCP methyltransferase, CheR-type [Thermoanaerobacter ethanolicus JW 200]